MTDSPSANAAEVGGVPLDGQPVPLGALVVVQLGFGRIVVSDTEAPALLANLLRGG